jgi:hypothetical protein
MHAPQGFLKQTACRELGKSVMNVKYAAARGEPTVKTIRVPDPRNAGRLPEAPLDPVTLRPTSSRTMTALESVVASHMIRTQRIKSANPQFRQTSRDYGSRLPLEQFGIAEHAVRSTLRSARG